MSLNRNPKILFLRIGVGYFFDKSFTASLFVINSCPFSNKSPSIVYIHFCCYIYSQWFPFLYILFSSFADSIPLFFVFIFFSTFLSSSYSSSSLQGAGGGTVVTVSVAEPDVDSDGSVYDVAEISQVIITLSLFFPLLVSLIPFDHPFHFVLFPYLSLFPLSTFSDLLKNKNG